MTSVTIGWWACAGTRGWSSTELRLTRTLPAPDGHGRQGPAAFCRAEVTADRRFTGGELVRASRALVAAWAPEYGIELPTR